MRCTVVYVPDDENRQRMATDGSMVWFMQTTPHQFSTPLVREIGPAASMTPEREISTQARRSQRDLVRESLVRYPSRPSGRR